jgi:hypothetical protein
MGIMQNKVTRRVALGTFAAGLGGAALVLQSLKSKYRTELPPGPKRQDGKDPNYEKDWETFAEMVDVPVVPIDGPSTITLDFKPQAGAKYRVTTLLAVYWKRFSEKEFPSSPLWYSVSDGLAAVISPIVEAEPAILITAEKSFTKNHLTSEADSRKDDPVDECVFVPTNRGTAYFKGDKSAYAKIPETEVNAACADLGKAIVFGYPRGKPLVKGVKWPISEALNSCIRLPCTVDGFAKIAGKRVAKILATGSITDAQLDDYCRQHYATVLMQKSTDHTLLEEAESRPFQLLAYVDVETGIAVRQECRLSSGPKAGLSGQTSYLITHVHDS